MNPRPPVRNWGAKANVAFIFASIAAVLVVVALLTAVIIDPPALGWVGFAIPAAVVVGLGAAATLLVEGGTASSRIRVAPGFGPPALLFFSSTTVSIVGVKADARSRTGTHSLRVNCSE